MTYRQLAQAISWMTDEQKDSDVTVLLMNEDEVYGACDFVRNWPDPKSPEGQEQGVDQVDGVLDPNHPYLTVIT